MSELTNVMRAATENMYNLVAGYNKDLTNFNTNMETKIAQVEKSLGEIKKNWSDSNFDAFHNQVKTKLASLKSQVARSRNLEGIISDTAKEFKEALNELK